MQMVIPLRVILMSGHFLIDFGNDKPVCSETADGFVGFIPLLIVFVS